MKTRFAFLIVFVLMQLAGNSAIAQTRRSEYSVTDEKIGATAYVYGRRTILEFSNPPGSLTVSDERNYPVSYERISDRMFRLSKQMDIFTALVNGKLVLFSFVRSEPTPAMPVNPAPVPQQVVQQPPAQPVPYQAPVVINAPAPVVTVQAQVPAPTPQPQPQRPVWTVTKQDSNLRVLLERWASLTNPRWEVVYKVDKELDMGGEFVVPEYDFKNAIRYITELTGQGGYKVKACFHTNNVVRIVPDATLCNPTKKEGI